jgi:2-polyprenyl-6-methoxyphenol hydroxylase-like FAD-dependent oxidoreductase
VTASNGLHVVVVGGSVAGLASALALATSGHRVTVLEWDSAEPPADPADAFAGWDRRGSPQTRHSHAFLARLHELLLERAPDLLEALFAAGADRLRFSDMARSLIPDAVLLPEDDQITLIACRRITFEWVLRRHVEALPGVTIATGARVRGLLAHGGRPLRVRGVRVARGRDEIGESLEADLVVDASGRRTRVATWLAELGGPPLRSESEPCGIFYSSRFYALRDGAQMPGREGPMAADLGFLKYGIFAGDGRTFSLTLAASPDDAPLRALFRRPAFERAARSLPPIQPWLDPAVATPISDVMPMANLHNARRFLVEAGEPVALGLACVGDAQLHTNPIVGRGCSLAFVNAFAIADALRDHPNDLRAFALDLEAKVERELVPWFEAGRSQDRDAIEVAELLRRGEDPWAVNRPDGSVDPRAMMRAMVRDGFVPAIREDIGVLRAFMRIFNLLDPPADLMKDASVTARVLQAFQRRDERPAPDAPTREALVAELAALESP